MAEGGRLCGGQAAGGRTDRTPHGAATAPRPSLLGGTSLLEFRQTEHALRQGGRTKVRGVTSLPSQGHGGSLWHSGGRGERL